MAFPFRWEELVNLMETGTLAWLQIHQQTVCLKLEPKRIATLRITL